MSFMSYHIIKQPVISEKSTKGNERGSYTFFVHPKANKIMIAEAVHARFGVDVVQVRVIQTPAKRVQRGRQHGWTEARKKAIVTLQKGQKIELA